MRKVYLWSHVGTLALSAVAFRLAAVMLGWAVTLRGKYNIAEDRRMNRKLERDYLEWAKRANKAPVVHTKVFAPKTYIEADCSDFDEPCPVCDRYGTCADCTPDYRSK